MTERSSPDGEEREALRRLYNEVSGCWNAFEYELRPVISNTNYACVQHKLDAAKAILDHPAPPQAMPQECRRLIKRIDELLHPEGFDPKEAHRELHELAHEFEKLCTQPQAAPEPMAYYVEHKNYGVELSLDPPSEAAIERGWIGTPLYAHPTPPQAASTPDAPGKDRWPAKGDRMKFLGVNEYPFELEAAKKIFTVGNTYEVHDCNVRNWSHSIQFVGVKGNFNGAMFELCTLSRPK